MENKVVEKAVWEDIDSKETESISSFPPIGFCYKCGMEIPPSSEFCPSCGIQLFWDCPKCKHKFLSKYAFCPKCGTNREVFLAEEKRIQEQKHEEERRSKERELAMKIAAEREEAEKQELIRLVNEEIKRIPEFTEAYNFLNKSKLIYTRKSRRDNIISGIFIWIFILVISFCAGGVIVCIVASIAEWFNICLWESTLLIIIGIIAGLIMFIYLSMEAVSWKPNIDDYIPRKTDFKNVAISPNIEKLIFNQIAYSKREFGWDSYKLEQWLISSYRNVYGIGLDTVPYAWLTEKPTFPSQYIDFYHWLKNNIKYPREAKENRIEGSVIVTFTVNKLGYIENVNIKQSVHPLLDSEVLRVISKSPKWSPGRFKGIAVPVTYQHTETFKI